MIRRVKQDARPRMCSPSQKGRFHVELGRPGNAPTPPGTPPSPRRGYRNPGIINRRIKEPQRRFGRVCRGSMPARLEARAAMAGSNAVMAYLSRPVENTRCYLCAPRRPERRLGLIEAVGHAAAWAVRRRKGYPKAAAPPLRRGPYASVMLYLDLACNSFEGRARARANSLCREGPTDRSSFKSFCAGDGVCGSEFSHISYNRWTYVSVQDPAYSASGFPRVRRAGLNLKGGINVTVYK
jgi:hypothetical protein